MSLKTLSEDTGRVNPMSTHVVSHKPLSFFTNFPNDYPYSDTTKCDLTQPQLRRLIFLTLFAYDDAPELSDAETIMPNWIADELDGLKEKTPGSIRWACESSGYKTLGFFINIPDDEDVKFKSPLTVLERAYLITELLYKGNQSLFASDADETFPDWVELNRLCDDDSDGVGSWLSQFLSEDFPLNVLAQNDAAEQIFDSLFGEMVSRPKQINLSDELLAGYQKPNYASLFKGCMGDTDGPMALLKEASDELNDTPSIPESDLARLNRTSITSVEFFSLAETYLPVEIDYLENIQKGFCAVNPNFTTLLGKTAGEAINTLRELFNNFNLGEVFIELAEDSVYEVMDINQIRSNPYKYMGCQA